MASCWTLAKQPQCSNILHTYQPSYSPQRFETTLNGLFMNKPAVFYSKPAHALITWTKVNLSGHIPPHCICRKYCTAFSDCPSFTYFVSFLFHAKMLNCTVPGAIAAIFAAIHSGFHMSSSQSASHVFLCLKSRYLSFVYNQKSRLSWSAMYSPHPTHQKYHQNRKSRTEILSISKRILSEHIAIYLPSPAY